MATKITQAQLDANTNTYKVDDYRNMVNYVSGTNKGYVRFTKGSDGKLKLEKFNNKLDVPLSWRSNTSAAHNKAVREKFLAAMADDLKFMAGDAANEIRRLILAPKKPGEDVEDIGTALSRREVKRIFERFDAQFNTGNGRICILANFMKEAKSACGFDGTDEEFARDYLKTEDIGIDPRLTVYITSKKAEEAEALPPHQRMVKSEGEFRHLLCQLDGLVAGAKLRMSVETTLKSVAKTLAKDGGEFGVRFDNDAEGKIRSALVKLLGNAGVTDVDLGFGSKNTMIEMFIKNVVPVLVKECAANIKDLPDQSDDKAIASVADADLNIDRVFSLAREFVEGAKEAVADMADVPPEGGDAVDRYISGMKAVFQEQIAGLNKVAVFKEAREVFALNVNGGKIVNPSLAKEVAAMTPIFVKEAKLDKYAADFLKKHFARSAGAIVEHEGNFMDKAREVIEKVKVAGQLNFGERWQTNPDAKSLSDVRLAAGGNVETFLSEMGNEVATIVNEKKGGLPLYEKLMSRTLTAILNEKIRNAADSKGRARIHIDAAAFNDVKTRLKRTVDTYCEFRDGKGALILEKAEDAFRRQLDRLDKKGNLDEQSRKMLLEDFRIRMTAAFKNATARYLDMAPRGADLDEKETREIDLTFLTNALNEEKGEVLADMRQRIATIVLTRALNQDVRKALITDMPARVSECAARLEKEGIKPKFETDDATMGEALKKLYYKVLADQCNSKAIAGKRVGDDLVKKVTDAFYSAAKDLVKNTNALADLVDKDFNVMSGVATQSLFEMDNSRAHYKAELPKGEYDAMHESLRADLTIALKPRTDELKRKCLLNPDAYTKKTVGNFKTVGEMFERVGKDGVYTQNSVTRIFNDVVDARHSAVMAWIYNPTGPDGKGTFEGDMIAGEMQRLVEPNAGKAGEYATKLPKNERANIVSAAVKAVLASAEKYALSYATGGKEAFQKRIAAEVQAIVDRHVEAQAKFREQFVKDAQPYIAKYADALKTEKKDGIQVATDKMNAVLDEISRQKEPPAIKGFALAFDGMLQKLVNDRVDMKMDEFLAYSAKVTAAYDKCIPAFNEEINARREELKAAGATDDDLKFFDEKLAPVLRSEIETVLQTHIDNPNVETNAAAYGRAQAKTYVEWMVRAIKEADMSNAASLHAMLSSMDMRVLYRDVDTDNATQAAVATWMKSPEVQKLAGELRQAKMTLVAYGADSVCQAAKDARAKVEEFKNALREAVMGLKTAVLETAFNSKQVGPALSLFQVWLKQYELPNLTVYIDGSNMTLKEAAEAHFLRRVAEMQQKIVNNPDVREPLLSADYIKEFTAYLNKIGSAAIFHALENRLVSARVNDFLTAQRSYDVYNFSAQHGDDDNAEIRQAVTSQNMNDLVKILTDILDRTRHTMRGVVVSLEDMKRWGEVIDREFKRMVSDESPRLVRFDKFAISRLNMMTAIDLNNVSGEFAVRGFVKEALKAYLGTDIFEAVKAGTLSQKFLDKHKIDVAELVGYLNDLTMKAVKSAIEVLKKKAMSVVKPGDTLEPLPGLKELVAKFKKSASDAVASVALTADKKDRHAVALRAIAKELKPLKQK